MELTALTKKIIEKSQAKAMRLITGFKSKNIPRIMLTIPDTIKKNLLEPLIIIPPIFGTAYFQYA